MARGDHQPAVQAHPDGDHLRDHLPRHRQQPAGAADAQGDPGALRPAPQGDRHPAHPLRPGQGRGPRPHPGRPQDRPRPPGRGGGADPPARPRRPRRASGLMATFGLSEIQAQAILDMRLQRLTGLEREKILDGVPERAQGHRAASRRSWRASGWCCRSSRTSSLEIEESVRRPAADRDRRGDAARFPSRT
ncbi:MAG: hypothetical protein MZV70_64315 [Desulfobacterales bacterium]|nr:hypothetical protein [Desulfobacterales bacterium]